MPVRRGDVVVHRAQVGRRDDEVNVEVRVVVLLKLDGVQAVADEGGGRRKLLEQVADFACACKS